ncbi:MAG: hypothetical protein ACO20H_05750 [Bacteriovoracaceae bacterium]
MKKKILFLVSSKKLLNHFTQELSDLEFIDLSFETDGYKALGRAINESFDLYVFMASSPSINGTDLATIIKILESDKSIPTALIYGESEPSYEGAADFVLRNKKSLIRDLQALIIKVFKDQACTFGPPPIPKS